MKVSDFIKFLESNFQPDNELLFVGTRGATPTEMGLEGVATNQGKDQTPPQYHDEYMPEVTSSILVFGFGDEADQYTQDSIDTNMTEVGRLL